ncbi:MAG: hypothetical protein K2X36_10065 [Microbacteriaceae bacterium]|nr:hypothetical protein [Microbacteriaceae bacterium]
MTHSSVTVFCDESGNGNSGHLVVAAVALEDTDISAAQRTLHEEFERTMALAERSGIAQSSGDPARGFHMSDDKWGVQSSVIEPLAQSLRRKVFVFATDRTTVKSNREPDHLLELYRKLGLTVVRRYSNYASVRFVIETNDDLVPHMADLVTKWSAATRHGQVMAEQQPKAPGSLLAYADYFALPCASWLDHGMAPREKDARFMQFVKLLPSISLILSLEKGRLHSRTHPWTPVS